MESLKKSEIKELLDSAGIEYKSTLKKSELIELLKNIEEDKLSDIEEEEEEVEVEVEEKEEEPEKKEEEPKKVLKKVWHDTYSYLKGEKILNERTCNYTWEYV